MKHYPSSTALKLVSLTGPDDRVDPQELQAIAFDYPWVEWALLYVPHNEGAPRNPSRDWRVRYFDLVHPGNTAVHWCGKLAFEQLLSGNFPEELVQANRWQLNINPRKLDFNDQEIIDIISCALSYTPDVILQYHDGSKTAIDQWIMHAPKDRVGVLLDSSRGKGQMMDNFDYPLQFHDFYMGRAGGISPENVEHILSKLHQHHTNPYWIDMETGIRTDNAWDMDKAISILNASSRYIR